MLFSEIISNRYKIFARMKDEEKTRNIALVKYIETLASMSGIDISAWDAQLLFGSGSGNKLIEDKNEVNRRFFDEVERIAAAAPAPEPGSDIITDALKLQIKSAEARYVSGLIAQEQTRADGQLRSASEYYRAFEGYLKKAAEHFAAIRRLSGQNSGLEEQIRTVAGSTFWKFEGVEDSTKIVFSNRTDVMLTYRNPTAGIDINLNMGRYKVIFNMTNFEMRVVAHERNTNAGGYIHPHISNHGGICWGTAQTIATRQLAQCSIVEPMTLLATILMSYNASSPYQAIERFQEAVGLPEEIEARDEMDQERDRVRAIMAPVDAAQINLDRSRAAALANSVAAPQVPAAEIITTAGSFMPASTTTTSVHIEF